MPILSALAVILSISFCKTLCYNSFCFGNKNMISQVNKVNRITLRGNRNLDTTLVSNCFIDEYMVHANEAQIKIYLHLLRCIGANLPVSVSSIADRFNYTEKDILRALLYWDKEGLLSIEFDNEKNVVGICLNEIPASEAASNSAPVPVETTADTIPVENTVPAAAKPFYSLDKMAEFRNREEVKQLIFMTEHYMGKTLSKADSNSLLYMYEELHFPVDLIEYLIEYCVNNGHKSMRYIEKTALAWSDEGIDSVKAAKSNASHFKKEYFAVLKAFGISGRNPVDADIDFIKRWTNEYGFDIDIILEACNRTIRSISKPSFVYADTILKSWKEKEIHHKSDLAKLDESFQKEKTKKTPSQAYTTTDKFKNFEERTYDYSQLEQDLLRN